MALLNRCPFTEIDYPMQSQSGGYLSYTIGEGEHELNILIPRNYENWLNDSFFRSNKTALTGLLLNGQLGIKFKDDFAYLRYEELKIKLGEATFPNSPKEKHDNLFLNIYKKQNFDGETVFFENVNAINDPSYFRKLFFKSADELFFYVNTLLDEGLINSLSEMRILGRVNYFNLTYKGLSYAINLEEEGALSNNCFIAMSFGEQMGDIRTVVKAACIATGYTPILIDEVHHDADTTINDAIIANLKKSRFCIADFTEQKKGVYFESGYALGQGKQVIYTCRNDSFNESHFDTNHFPHLLYDTLEELKNKLINKIEAWIR